MRDQELIGLYEAYQQVHGLNESTEELEYDTQYSYEDWVNQLVEEGYDLSNWTDEGLYEYYEQLCEESLEIPQSPTPGGKKPATSAIPPKPPKGTPVNTGYKESYDIVFEYLISEGYADTNENALVIMANMSEDWKYSILSEAKKTTADDIAKGDLYSAMFRRDKKVKGAKYDNPSANKYLNMKNSKDRQKEYDDDMGNVHTDRRPSR